MDIGNSWSLRYWDDPHILDLPWVVHLLAVKTAMAQSGGRRGQERAEVKILANEIMENSAAAQLVRDWHCIVFPKKGNLQRPSIEDACFFITIMSQLNEGKRSGAMTQLQQERFRQGLKSAMPYWHPGCEAPALHDSVRIDMSDTTLSHTAPQNAESTPDQLVGARRGSRPGKRKQPFGIGGRGYSRKVLGTKPRKGSLRQKLDRPELDDDAKAQPPPLTIKIPGKPFSFRHDPMTAVLNTPPVINFLCESQIQISTEGVSPTIDSPLTVEPSPTVMHADEIQLPQPGIMPIMTEEQRSRLAQLQLADYLPPSGSETPLLTASSMTVKIPLPCLPPVWAVSRQEICETLPYFRSYQSGIYFNNSIALGYLLGGFPANRDAWIHNGKLIISHGGGNHQLYNKRVPIEPQESTRTGASALFQAYEDQRPIALLVGRDYKLFPYELGLHCNFLVLGYYRIIHAWTEAETSSDVPSRVVKSWRFAFQWLDTQGTPWWLEDPRPQPGIVHPIDAVMSGFNPSHLKPVMLEEPDPLVKDSPIVNSRPPRVPIGLRSLTTNNPKTSCDGPEIEATLKDNPREYSTGGTWCKVCDKFSPRIYSRGWLCFNTDCSDFCKFIDNTYLTWHQELDYCQQFFCPSTPQPAYTITSFEINAPLPILDRNVHFNRVQWKGLHCRQCGRLSCREFWNRWECMTCKISMAIIHTIYQAQDLRYSTCTPNQFIDHETVDSKAEWHQLKCGSLAIVYTYTLPENIGHIIHVQNCGANDQSDKAFKAYQEAALTCDLFRRYPLKTNKVKGAILTRHFCHNAGQPYNYVVKTPNMSFEESPQVISQAREIITEVTSDILGEPIGFNEVLSCAYMVDQKMGYHSDSEKGVGPVIASLSLGSRAKMSFRRIEGRRALALNLEHGDILIMNGARIQEEYQHCVIPEGFRIAATARYISPNPDLSLMDRGEGNTGFSNDFQQLMLC